MEIKLWMILVFAVWIIGTINAIYTIIKRPYDIFEKDKTSPYYDDYGCENFPYKTPITNTYLLIMIGFLFCLFLYSLSFIPFTKTVLTL